MKVTAKDRCFDNLSGTLLGHHCIVWQVHDMVTVWILIFFNTFLFMKKTNFFKKTICPKHCVLFYGVGPLSSTHF